MCINHEVDDLISGGHVETLAEPVNAHLSGEHGVKHEVLQVLLGLGVGKEFVCHVDIIGTGCPPLGSLLCHLVNWLGRLTSLY
jgi:hypothetical protein